MGTPINPNLVEIVKIPDLPDLAIQAANYIAHSGANGVAGKINFTALVDFISQYLPNLDSSPFVPFSGTVLPNPVDKPTAVTFVGAQTSTQTTGGNVVTTQPLNVLFWTSNGTTGTWTIGVAIPIDLTGYVQKTDQGYIDSTNYSRQNDLTDAESTFASLGRWQATLGSPTFSIVSGKLRITFTSGTNQAVGIPGLMVAGVDNQVSLKIKLISGTATNFFVGFQSSTPNAGTLVVSPGATEVTYSAILNSATNQPFSIGTNIANNTGQVIEIDDVVFLKSTPALKRLSTDEQAILDNKTKIDALVGVANILDTNTSTMVPPTNWTGQINSPTISYSSGIMSLTFTSNSQSIYVMTGLMIGKKYTAKIRARVASGTTTKLRVGKFETTPSANSAEINLTNTFADYEIEITAGVVYFAIGVLSAFNTGGVIEIDTVEISLIGDIIQIIDDQISGVDANIGEVFYNTNAPFSSLSKYDKPLTRIVVVGDSLMANPIGGDVPPGVYEGNNYSPIRLKTNNIARRLYDELSYNKATWVRLSASEWTKSGTWASVNNDNIFEPIYANESYYSNTAAGSYIEITIPDGVKNFALVYQEQNGYSPLTVTLNGGDISAYGATTIVTSFAGLGHTGNPYATSQYLNLPAGANVIRVTRDNTSSPSFIWGGFHWTGNTLMVINASHGGHTLNNLLVNHIDAEVVGNKPDAILFELTLMNDAARMTDAGNTIANSQAALTTILTNKMNGKDLLIMTTPPYGTDPSDGTPNYYTAFPGMEEMKNGLKEVCISKQKATIDIFEVFKRKVENRGGTLIGGQAGIWYTTDGQHGNPAGVLEWWNIIKNTITDNPLKAT